MQPSARQSDCATDRTHGKSSELRAPVGCGAQEASGEVHTTTGTRHEDTPTHKHARNKDRPEPHAFSVAAHTRVHLAGKKPHSPARRAVCGALEALGLPRQHRVALPC